MRDLTFFILEFFYLIIITVLWGVWGGYSGQVCCCIIALIDENEKGLFISFICK